jgi:hypothetical protein
MSTQHHPGMPTLQQALTAFSAGQITVDTFCQMWRGQDSLLQNLPARYREVMEDLLGRLETGDQFSQESCSYSQEELLANLADWLAKAQRTLAA